MATFTIDLLTGQEYLFNGDFSGSGGTGGGSSVTKIIVQPSHGFLLGDVIGISGGTYNRAIADGTYGGEIIGIVSNVVDVDSFELTQAGYVDTLIGLIPSTTYFLSTVVPGAITTTEPSVPGQIIKAVLVADSVTSGWILPYPAYYVSSGGSGGGNGFNVTKLITQALHGFSVNDVVGFSGGTYNKAIANGTYQGEIVGLVTKINDLNNFELTQSGYISGLTAVLTPSTTYFLSTLVPGLLTSVEPSLPGQIVKSVIVADTISSGWILPYPAYYVSSGSTIATTLQLKDITGNTEVNDISATPIVWTTQEFAGTSLSFTGGSKIWINETAVYKIAYVLNVISQTVSPKNVGAVIRINGLTDIEPTTSTSATVNGSGDTGTNTLPEYRVSLTIGDYIELVAFRVGDAGSVLSKPNSSWIAITKT